MNTLGLDDDYMREYINKLLDEHIQKERKEWEKEKLNEGRGIGNYTRKIVG